MKKTWKTCNTNMANSFIEMGLASKPIDTNQDHHKACKQERAKVEDRSASRNLSQEDDNHRESLQQRFAMLTEMLQANAIGNAMGSASGNPKSSAMCQCCYEGC